MKTVGEVLMLSHDFLKKKSVRAARLSAEELLAHILRCSRMDLYLKFDQPLQENEIESMRQLIKRRALHEPVEYILGKVEFFGATLKLNEKVLIPRPETEILLDLSTKQEREFFEKKIDVLDLCTGSGCIAIALKKKFPNLSLVASDISKEALEVAKKNAETNQVDVRFIQSDLFGGFSEEKFDVVFCNPPYISKGEFLSLDPDVKHYEPEVALWGGEDGGDCYRKIAKEVKKYLKPRAKLFFEIGYAQGKQIQEIFNDPCWTKKNIYQDWSGKDRFFFLEFE